MSLQKIDDDVWLSGEPMDLILFDVNESDIKTAPKVQVTLPNGQRITTTLGDYNRSMPFIFKKEVAWKNHMNLLKRQRMGLTEDENKEVDGFEKMKQEYYDDFKKKS